MKKQLITLLFVLLAFAGFGQTTVLKGTVQAANGGTIPNVTVSVYGTNYFTNSDSNGVFQFDNLGAGLYKLGFFVAGYESYYTNDIKVKKDQTTDLGAITLNPILGISNEGSDNDNTDDVNSDLYSSESTSSILHGSRDPYADNISYSLFGFGFKYRGYDGSYTGTSINGADVSNMETGRTYWSEWGGLNDISRLKNSSIGLKSADNTFGKVGGNTDIQMIPSLYRKGFRISYARTNRTYNNRLMATYSTGLMANNWAITVSGSRRWAQQGYVQGTFYDAWAYFFGVEKRFSNQRIIFNFFGAPIIRGKQGPSTQEAYDLLDNYYYNPYWGYQDGKIRNSRVANTHEPMAVLTHLWNINSTTTLNTTLVGRYGRNGSTTLDWYNAADPRPDYYTYLPSHITNPQSSDYETQKFLDYSQINWANLYYANSNSYDTLYSADGSDSIAYNRAQYVIEETRYDEKFVNLTSNFTKQFSDNLKAIAGISGKYFQGHNYLEMVDLLGAQYWLDIDKYATRDLATATTDQRMNPMLEQNDMNNPNHLVKVGDIFGYNYYSNVTNLRFWNQFVYDNKYFNVTISDFVSYETMYREGMMKNGKFPDNSYGKSATHTFIDYGGKMNLVVKINGRNFIQANAVYMTEAPDFNNVYISARTRDYTVDNPMSEKIMSFDAGYVMRAPNLKITLNAFYTDFRDQSKVMSFYHDGYNAFVNYSMTGVSHLHQGIEAAFDVNINSSLSAYAAGTISSYRYTTRPFVTVTVDNSSTVIADNKVVYMDNFVIPTVPQTAVTAGLRYRAKHYWSFYLNANYVQDRYLDFNPDRRTEPALIAILPGSDQWNAIVNQQKLDPAYTIDASVTKSFRIMHKYYFAINANLTNILNNKKIISGGFEQLRFDDVTQNPNKFAPKYFYMYGRQFFINFTLSF